MNELLRNNLKWLRGQHHLSQYQAANVFEVKGRTYQAWEEGRGTPNLDRICAICDYYEITADDLIRVDLSKVYKVLWNKKIVKVNV